jgi:phosphatidylethanolamine/phosphatidyl-N-methylethanolamine N-methyltransferase
MHSASFLRAWIESPLRTGAQLPSGRDLSNAMAAPVDPDGEGAVVELGAGTGAVTQALVDRGVDPQRLVLIEANAQFCELLGERYGKARVLQQDAYAAPRVLRHLDVGPVAAIVSSLPLLTQAPSRRLRLLLECLRLAAAGAPFVQFTYFYRSPIPISRAPIATEVSPMVWRNLWPARVWRYRLSARAGVAAAS